MNSLYRRGTAVSGQGRISSRLRLALCCALACASFTATPAHSAVLSEDDLLLLDMVLERQRVASSVTAYSRGSAVLMSLAEVGAALQFPIVVEANSGIASGSIIRPERTFELNAAAQYVEIEGVRKSFDANDVVVNDNGIFVKLEVLSQWFPVDFQLNKADLSVSILPREPLPTQIRNARRSSAQQDRTIGPAVLPPIDNSYRFLGFPAADIGLGYWTRRNRKTNTSSSGLNYSALVSGDVAFMDARVYLGGNHTDALTNLRASLSRDNLGMPLGLRYIEIGDIVPAIVPGLRYNGVERGILIQGGGSVTGRDDLIDSNLINISGDALEGWDVELFQAGMRVGFQTVGSNGRYSFQNIEPVAGENVFELGRFQV